MNWLHLLMFIVMFFAGNTVLAEKVLIPGTGLIAGDLKTNEFFTLEQPNTPEKPEAISINIKKIKAVKVKINQILTKRELSKIKKALHVVTHQLKTKKAFSKVLLSVKHSSLKKQHKIAMHKAKHVSGKNNKIMVSSMHFSGKNNKVMASSSHIHSKNNKRMASSKRMMGRKTRIVRMV